MHKEEGNAHSTAAQLFLCQQTYFHVKRVMLIVQILTSMKFIKVTDPSENLVFTSLLS